MKQSKNGINQFENFTLKAIFGSQQQDSTLS